MWLINTHSLNLEYFIEVDPDVQKYAILSHAWGPEEVTLQEMMARERGIDIPKLGFEKIKQCCRQAEADGFEFAWVDTCCIDKTSSAELSESINSMFNWYQEAQVCYVFMYDVPAATAFTNDGGDFAKSRWFTRGWTLQELIAPSNVQFFSKEWVVIGTKSSLRKELHAITRINMDVLSGEEDVLSTSIACRMSWAADRKTTRTEDIAYCLLGIFDVNMPMLYGEGRKAFIRLQQEIVRNSDDHSIFAWADPDALDMEERSLLAPHPSCFRDSGRFVPYYGMFDKQVLKMEFTNRGLALRVLTATDLSGKRMATLRCSKSVKADSFGTIVLNESNGFYDARIYASKLGTGHYEGMDCEIHVPQITRKSKKVREDRPIEWFSLKPGTFENCEIEDVWISRRSSIKPAKTRLVPTLFGCWAPISEFGDLSRHVCAMTVPRQCVMGLRLANNMYVVIGVLEGGRLGAELLDWRTMLKAKSFDRDAVFQGVACPGHSVATDISAGTFVLRFKFSEPSSTEALGAKVGLELDCRPESIP